MKRSRKGVSNVIYSVLIIGIVFVSFLIVYNVVNPILKQKTGEVESGFDKLLKMFSFSASENEPLISLTGNIILDSGESCYINLNINEKKIRDIYNEQGEIISQDIEFSLVSLENLFGNYESLVNYYNLEIPSSYVLRTYDASNEIIENYSLDSGRFIFYDSFGDAENPGGIIEVNESVISALIPYDKRISKIMIEYNNTSTDLNVDPAGFKCERTCKIENETILEDEGCCLGFIKSEQQDSSYRCVKCGDEICSSYENEYSCYKDCRGNFTCQEGYIKKEFGCEAEAAEVAGESVNSCLNLNKQGKTYALNQDISAEGNDYCIKITASDITLDCQGHSITSENDAAGVYSNQLRTIIKNCKISVGIENCMPYCSGDNSKGIYLEGADNSQIFNNELGD